MINFKDINSQILLINPYKSQDSSLTNKWNTERLYSVLYSQDYTVIPIKEYNGENYTDSFIGIPTISDNDEFRKNSLAILEFLNIETAIIKYNNQSDFVKISKNGEEKPLMLLVNESIDNNIIFIYEGMYFSFKEKVRYFFPKVKEHLKNGMIVEYLNDNKWFKKEIKNLDTEYDKMYKLLIKYEKLRVPTQ